MEPERQLPEGQLRTPCRIVPSIAEPTVAYTSQVLRTTYRNVPSIAEPAASGLWWCASTSMNGVCVLPYSADMRVTAGVLDLMYVR